MKTNNLLIILLTLFSISCFSQITVSIQSLEYTNNGESTENVSNCGTIDLKSSTSTSINFGVNLSKPNQATGTGTLYIYTKKSSANSRVQLGSSQYIQESFWNQPSSGNHTYSTTISRSINASDFAGGSGGTLFVVFKLTGGTEYLSCSYTIKKDQTPTFELDDDSYDIPCGTTTTAYTFTAVNKYNSPGTVSYSWNVGNGWKYSGGTPVSGTITTTQNFITLSPNLGIVLPSNVSMTPTLDGVQYPTKTSTITRSDIVETITSVSGSSIVCSGGFNYTLDGNLISGQSVSYSLSNNSIATLSNASNTGVTINVTGNGALNLTATISNGCGQSYTRTKSLFAGAPPAFAVARGTAESEYCDIKYHYVPFTMADKNPLLNYNVTVFGMPPSTVSSFNANGFVLKFSKTFSGWVDFIVTASNSCGSKGVFREAHIDDCNSIPYGSQLRISEPVSVFKVYPNPSSDVVYLDLADTDNVPEKNQKIEAILYDMLGYKKEQVKIINNKASIDVSVLDAGLYILRVSINGETETHLISVK